MRLAAEAQHLALLRGAVGNVIPRVQWVRLPPAAGTRVVILRAGGGVRACAWRLRHVRHRRHAVRRELRCDARPGRGRSGHPLHPGGLHPPRIRGGAEAPGAPARRTRRGPRPHGWPRAPAAARAAAGPARRQRPAGGRRGRRRASQSSSIGSANVGGAGAAGSGRARLAGGASCSSPSPERLVPRPPPWARPLLCCASTRSRIDKNYCRPRVLLVQGQVKAQARPVEQVQNVRVHHTLFNPYPT